MAEGWTGNGSFKGSSLVVEQPNLKNRKNFIVFLFGPECLFYYHQVMVFLSSASYILFNSVSPCDIGDLLYIYIPNFICFT